MQVDICELLKPTRLDRVLRDRFPEWGRQAIQQLISSRQVQVNGKTVWLASWQVKNGDQITLLTTPEAKPTPPQGFDPRWLLAEEADLLVINKPAGLLSEAPRFRETANLLNLARARFGELILFHRLDRDTSGIMLLTRPGPINRYLDRAFKAGLVKKTYVAVVATPNQLESEGTITARLDQHPRRRDMMAVVTRGGKHAVTDYRIIATGPDKHQQLVELHPQTGRTHQLRVHLAHRHAPILGDRLYGDEASADRLLLHAAQLVLPALDGYPVRTYAAPMPEAFEDWDSLVSGDRYRG
ncbi:MAG: RluA family pseudouridine synthase [Caldilineaceae bacterium]